MMETLLDGGITISAVVGVLIKIAMLLLFLLSLIMLKQTSMMTKVVSFPVGGNVKVLVWGFCVLMLLLTVIVVIV